MAVPDYEAINEEFLSRVGYLALIGTKGPYRQLNINEKINNVKVIDDPAAVIAGDLAYAGNEHGVVVSNTVTEGRRAITVKYGPIDKPAHVTAAAWSADYDTLAFWTKEYYTNAQDETGESGVDTHHNPYIRLASLGVVFARHLYSPVATAPTITLESAAPTIQEGGAAVSLDFNVGGVSIQTTVNNVNSGAPVVANGSGVASIPNTFTAGQAVRFVVSKTGYNTQTFGPYTVAAP